MADLTHVHAGAAPRRRADLPVSLLRLSAALRLAWAGVMILALWLAVMWAW